MFQGWGCGPRAQRNPPSQSETAGLNPFRSAERKPLGTFLKEPPRNTRREPVAGPT